MNLPVILHEDSIVGVALIDGQVEGDIAVIRKPHDEIGYSRAGLTRNSCRVLAGTCRIESREIVGKVEDAAGTVRRWRHFAGAATRYGRDLQVLAAVAQIVLTDLL